MKKGENKKKSSHSRSHHPEREGNYVHYFSLFGASQQQTASVTNFTVGAESAGGSRVSFGPVVLGGSFNTLEPPHGSFPQACFQHVPKFL